MFGLLEDTWVLMFAVLACCNELYVFSNIKSTSLTQLCSWNTERGLVVPGDRDGYRYYTKISKCYLANG